MSEIRRLDSLLQAWRPRATDTSSRTDQRDDSLWTPEGTPDCKVCGGAGYLRVARPLTDPDFGRVEPCQCQREQHQSRVAQRLLRLSNLGPLAELRIGDGDQSTPSIATACQFADESDDQHGWLLLTGAAGSGRTQLCAELANRRISAGRPALYFVAADLLDRLRAAMNAPAAGDLSFALLFEHVRDAPFLVLDDLDCVSPTDWAREKLFQLLNHRRNSGLRTVLVSETADLSGIGLQSMLRQPQLLNLTLGGAQSFNRYREFGGMSQAVLKQFSFESFREQGLGGSSDAENLHRAKSEVREWAQQPAGWLTLVGGVGVGKTHLAAAAANVRLIDGASVCFAVVPELLDALRASYRDEGEASFESLFAWLKSVDLLVLDDLGAHSGTEWATEKLYQLCAHRYLQRSPTLITMNVRPEDLDARIASRLLDSQLGKVLYLRALDYRTKLESASVNQPKRRARRRP